MDTRNIRAVPYERAEEETELVSRSDGPYVATAPSRRLTGFRKQIGIVISGLGLVLCIAIGLVKLGSKPQFEEYIPGSHPGFVNYDAVAPHRSLASNPPLCDYFLVNDTCTALNAETIEVGYGNAIDKDNRYIHAIELQEVLSASKKSIISLFSKVQLKNWDPKTPDAFAVSCQELCEKLVASYPPKALTKVSNVGCYYEEWHLEPTCDVDVSSASLSGIQFPDTPASKMDDQYLETPAMAAADPDSNATNTIDSALNNAVLPTAEQAAIIHNVTYADQDFDTLRSNLLNLFHIHPAIRSKTADGTGLLGPEFEPATPPAPAPVPTTPVPVPVPVPTIPVPVPVPAPVSPARRAEEKVPIDSGSERQLLGRKDNSCRTANDGSCDYATGACAAGTDCSDCRDCDNSISARMNGDTCRYARDGSCDEPPRNPYYCYAGTDCTDCGNCAGGSTASRRRAPPSVGNAAPAWKRTVLQRAVKAKAYIANCLTKMASRRIGNVVTKWFGNNNDYPTRSEIKRILNSVRGMLNNVDYVYPGDKCTARTYAYVYPNPGWNKDSAGKFIFYLCDYYMKVDESEQIETLTHEGSHHVSARTDDSKSPIDGKTMYGRSRCQAVANLCARQGPSSIPCTKARKNADSVCYFINDGNSATGTGVGASRRRVPNPSRRRSFFFGSRRRTDSRRRFFFR